MTRDAKEQVRRAALEAMEYYPNSHLGDYTRRQDLRSAFRSMRCAVDFGMDIWEAAGHVYRDARRYANM